MVCVFSSIVVVIPFFACVAKKKAAAVAMGKFTSSFCKFSKDLLMAVNQMISSCVCASASEQLLDLESQTVLSALSSASQLRRAVKNTASCAARKCTTLSG